MRYPYSVPVAGNYLDGPDAPTGRMDFLKIQRYRINFDAEAGYGGENLPSNKTARVLNESVVYINMPQSISSSYNASYNTSNLGAGGALAIQLAQTVGGMVGQGKSANAAMIEQQVKSAVSAALPEFAYSTAAQAINQLGGLAHDAANAGTLQALSSGRIMNPYTEQTFTGTSFRQHNFTFKMFARNQSEAIEILNIINYLKVGASPRYGTADLKAVEGFVNSFQGKNSPETTEDAADESGDASNNNEKTDAETTVKAEEAENTLKLDEFSQEGAYLEIPDRFLLEFVRLDTATDSISPIPHFKFKPCVCRGINVNYTPDGQYVSFKDAILDLGSKSTQMMVPAVEITLDFAETQFITQADITAGF